MYYTGPNLALKAEHTQASETTLCTKKLHAYRKKTCIKAWEILNQDLQASDRTMHMLESWLRYYDLRG